MLGWSRHKGGLGFLVVALTLAGVGPAGAEDRISLRGTYFREASTRVVQPMVEGRFELPKGYDVNAHALVDAISSASIAQGAATDEIFHENRYEAGLAVGRTFAGTNNATRVGAFFRYSHEPDYVSYSGGLSLTRDVLDKTGTIGLSAAVSHDDIEPNPPLDPRKLDVVFAGISYAQALTPTTLVQGGYEFFYFDGAYCNPYISHPDLGREKCPEVRIRHALGFKVAQYLPRLRLGAQLHYRFYFDQGAFGAIDPWGMTAHTIEPRLYKTLGEHFEVRLSYRFHWQGDASFWCNARPDNGGQLGCYTRRADPSAPIMTPKYHSWDPKFGSLTTHFPEVKLMWDLRVLSRLPALTFLAAGTLDLSYGYYFQSTPYGQKFTDKTAPPVIGWGFTRDHGGAHIMQTGFTLPF
ncbi:MAG TPA: DUF3570 domain-containing protein [Polyangia bacterium]